MEIEMGKIKLIVSDLDGTLIPEGTTELEDGFKEALNQLLDQGIEFYAASGRPYPSIKSLFPEYRNQIGFICENGSMVVEMGRISQMNTIPDFLAREVSEQLIENRHTDVLISGATRGYICPKTQWFQENMKQNIKNEFTCIEHFDEIQEPVVKIATYIYDFEQHAESLRQELTKTYGEYADFVYTGNDWLDMIMKGTGKGAALKNLMERKGLRPEEVMVFGDNENDISMLQLTPNSYAKNHSAPHVKENAGYECESVTKILKGLL
jgi:hypothetical protein